MNRSTTAQLMALIVVVAAICMLAIYDRLNGEAGAMLGSVVGYLVNNLAPPTPYARTAGSTHKSRVSLTTLRRAPRTGGHRAVRRRRVARRAHCVLHVWGPGTGGINTAESP